MTSALLGGDTGILAVFDHLELNSTVLANVDFSGLHVVTIRHNTYLPALFSALMSLGDSLKLAF
jgi:hypothetical protein